MNDENASPNINLRGDESFEEVEVDSLQDAEENLEIDEEFIRNHGNALSPFDYAYNYEDDEDEEEMKTHCCNLEICHFTIACL